MIEGSSDRPPLRHQHHSYPFTRSSNMHSAVAVAGTAISTDSADRVQLGPSDPMIKATAAAEKIHDQDQDDDDAAVPERHLTSLEFYDKTTSLTRAAAPAAVTARQHYARRMTAGKDTAAAASADSHHHHHHPLDQASSSRTGSPPPQQSASAQSSSSSHPFAAAPAVSSSTSSSPSRPASATSGARTRRPRSASSLSDHSPPSSSSSTAAAAAAAASTHRLPHFADPDHHWLSEDEGSHQVQQHQHRVRRSSTDRRRRARGEMAPAAADDDEQEQHEDEEERDRSARGKASFASTINDAHPIHHRPAATPSPSSSPPSASVAAATPPTRSSTPIASTSSALLSSPSLDSIVPALIALLCCPSCSNLLDHPTTLVCGHSICLACSMRSISLSSAAASKSTAASILLQRSSSTEGATSTMGTASESQFEANASMGMNTSPRLGQIVLPFVESILGAVLPFTSSSSSASSSSAPPQIAAAAAAAATTILRSRTICPVKDCKHKDRSPMNGLVEPKVDFVLHKVLGLLHRDLATSEVDLEEMARALFVDEEDEEEEEEEEEDQDEIGEGYGMRRPTLRKDVSSSSASSSSGGGGEDQPENEEDSKRLHRSTKNWSSSKRLRRFSDLGGVDEDHIATSSLSTAAAASTSRIAGVQHHRQQRPSSTTAIIDIDQTPSTFLSDLHLELECRICYELYNEPVGTPCGHTFCQKCLARSLDHSDTCPLCRADFPSFTFFQSQPVSSTTAALVSTAFPKLSADRKRAIEAEERSNSLDTPIFVCTLAWPNLPTYIHIFEPRYRLMMRRVMDSDQQFGMVLPSRNEGGVGEYGTMLRVISCNLMEDGRSIVETVGTYRFRLLEKGTFDGYTVGRIERVDDISAEQEAELERIALARNVPGVVRDRAPPVVAPRTADSPPPASPSGAPPAQQAIELSTTELMSICLEFVETLRSGSAPWVIQRLNNTIGPMPTNPSDFSYWMAEVMPVDDHVKAALLQITSSRERLRLLVFWIDQFRSAWWFRSGCTIM